MQTQCVGNKRDVLLVGLIEYIFIKLPNTARERLSS